jgi:hypothetical protein
MESGRLLEVLGALSLATDLSAGLPAQTAVRTAVIAGRLARAWKADQGLVREAQLAALLRYLGCSGAATEAARLNAGDDLGFLRVFADADLGNPSEMQSRARGLAPGAPEPVRSRVLLEMADPRTASALSTAHCEVAVGLSTQLGVADGVTPALGQIYERFDGRGGPARLRGDAIAPTARVVHAVGFMTCGEA